MGLKHMDDNSHQKLLKENVEFVQVAITFLNLLTVRSPEAKNKIVKDEETTAQCLNCHKISDWKSSRFFTKKNCINSSTNTAKTL